MGAGMSKCSFDKSAINMVRFALHPFTQRVGTTELSSWILIEYALGFFNGGAWLDLLRHALLLGDDGVEFGHAPCVGLIQVNEVAPRKRRDISE